jgi:hypothetical protein
MVCWIVLGYCVDALSRTDALSRGLGRAMSWSYAVWL